MGFLGWLTLAVLTYYTIYAVIGVIYCHVKVRKNLTADGKGQLDRNSWLMRWCYGPTAIWNDGPYQTLGEWKRSFPRRLSACKLGTCFLLAPFAWVTIVSFCLCFLVIVVMVTVIGLFFAFRMAWFASDGDKRCRHDLRDFLGANQTLIYYQHWPRLCGKRIWPISVIGIALAAWSLGWFVHALILGVAWTWFVLGCFLLLSLLLATVFFVIFYLMNNPFGDDWQALKLYLKQRKEWLCLQVEVFDSKKKDEQG